jgi:hypothetical protein
VKQSEVEAGKRPGLTTEEREELKRLSKENRELQRVNDILMLAPLSSWRELLDALFLQHHETRATRINANSLETLGFFDQTGTHQPSETFFHFVGKRQSILPISLTGEFHFKARCSTYVVRPSPRS